MIKEAYVSYDVAKLLEKKGFWEEVSMYYDTWDEDDIELCSRDDISSEAYSYQPEGTYVKAPTHQMACAWVRDEHDIDTWVEYCIPDDAYVYTILIKDITDGFTIIHSEDNYPIYEEAVEAALKYILTNLM